MKKVMFACMVAAMILTASGCKTPSMNVRRSVARSTGDISSTIAIEKDKISKEDIAEAIAKVEEFLADNNLPDTITRDELVELIKEQVDVEQLNPVIEKISVIVPEDMNIKDVITVVKAFIKGLKTGSSEFVEISE